MCSHSLIPHRQTLLVGIEPDWLERVRSALCGSGLELLEVKSSSETVELTQSKSELLLIVGGCTVDSSGIALCRRLREDPECADVPILLVSRWASEADRVLAFENGVDDFLPDPFYPRELLSRVKALIRRGRSSRPALPTHEISFGKVRMDLRGGAVEVDGQVIALTAREFELLRLLVEHRGRVVSRSRLVEALLGSPDAVSSRVIDTHVKAIRRKLGEARDCIETLRGVGYRLDVD